MAQVNPKSSLKKDTCAVFFLTVSKQRQVNGKAELQLFWNTQPYKENIDFKGLQDV